MQTKDNYHNCLEKRQYLGVLFNLGVVKSYEKEGIKCSSHLNVDLFIKYGK